MGLFGKSTKNKQESKERKVALKSLKHLEKKRSRSYKMTTSVDPSKAINELQPWQDIYGRPIAEPDLTNPTRSRWERPLDTIRSFQESIDRGYRQSTYEDPPQPTSTQWTGRRIYGRNGGGSYSEQMSHMPNRVRDSGTPLSNSSGEDQMSSYGVMAAGNHLNDSSVPRSVQPRGQYGGFGYADTGYVKRKNWLGRRFSKN
ncbi:hypothetical protein FN846DRAFT_609193 [Sphaerosporella brunnea]|uniref:Uncharacterized protein n=1 Tax=Sphaerosporella brunnea TaxID=1250544 RepID=A0A5J5EBC7_9PEZI|nr:hypothetical protein FN846DRAFT_609193 [Sphaerosporella brunnea]